MIYRQIRRPPFRLLLYFTLALASAPSGVAQRMPRQQERLDEAFLEAVLQNQNLPDAYYKLPEQVREEATIIATGTYGQGRTLYIWMRDGTQVWARTSWFRITKVYRGKVGGNSIPINASMLPKTKYVSARLKLGREYLVLLRPGSKSLKVLEAGDYVPVRDALRAEEIIAILELE
jgi:hypothetical protein